MLTHVPWVALWVLLLVAAQPSRAQDVGVGGVSVIAVVDPSEVTDKWWFWLIIGLIAAFFVVAGFFVWRGWRQWKLTKQAEEQAEQKLQEEGKLAGSGGRVTVSAGSGGRDVELGHVGVRPPAAGEPLSEDQAAFLRDRERRTAVHPKRKW